jgi:hypothetical protein
VQLYCSPSAQCSFTAARLSCAALLQSVCPVQLYCIPSVLCSFTAARLPRAALLRPVCPVQLYCSPPALCSFTAARQPGRPVQLYCGPSALCSFTAARLSCAALLQPVCPVQLYCSPPVLCSFTAARLTCAALLQSVCPVQLYCSPSVLCSFTAARLPCACTRANRDNSSNVPEQMNVYSAPNGHTDYCRPMSCGGTYMRSARSAGSSSNQLTHFNIILCLSIRSGPCWPKKNLKDGVQCTQTLNNVVCRYELTHCLSNIRLTSIPYSRRDSSFHEHAPQY